MQTISAPGAIRLVLLLSAALTVAGCATTTGGGGATGKAVCASFRGISWADADTDATIRQVKAHNAVGRELCGWRP